MNITWQQTMNDGSLMFPWHDTVMGSTVQWTDEDYLDPPRCEGCGRHHSWTHYCGNIWKCDCKHEQLIEKNEPSLIELILLAAIILGLSAGLGLWAMKAFDLGRLT